MFGLCDSATTALIVCVIISAIIFIIMMVIGYKLDDSMETAWISGILSMMVCFLISLVIVMAIQNCDVDEEFKSSLSKNYPGYTDLGQCILINRSNVSDLDHSFRYDGQAYFCKFEYYKDKTLTVYANDGILDGVYVDGKKQQAGSDPDQSLGTDDNQAASDNRLTDDEMALISKIQDKIFEKYDGAKITNFDVIGFTGSFVYKNDTYDFSRKDNILKVKNTSDPSDISYYNVEN